MILLKKEADFSKWLQKQRATGQKIGFAPTMGALHAGHISLIAASEKDNPLTVSSIFVNPTQFNDPKDFDKYPITIEKDIPMLEAAGCDLLFLPSVKEIYPHGTPANKHYDLGYIETVLDGKFRPGHFQGVCMVVERLLEIVRPDRLYLGQKDYQQCMVITRLINLMGWKNKIEIVICPTLREENGLAMSSRNMRLSEEEKEKAAAIYKTLTVIKDKFRKTETTSIKQEAQSILEQAELKPDYIEIVNAHDLSPLTANSTEPAVALIAAFMNEVRLIDNMLLQ